MRTVGLCNHSVEQLERAEQVAHVDCQQSPLPAIRRTSAAFNAQAPHSQAWRFQNPRFTGVALQHNLKLADALKPVAARHGATVASVAIAWSLA